MAVKNNENVSYCGGLELVPLRSENYSIHKTGFWDGLGALFKISKQHPRPFIREPRVRSFARSPLKKSVLKKAASLA